jgi:cyclopropane fatty-acyl-phospholipid synthase-like methyltransferase
MSLISRITFEMSYLLGAAPWDSGVSPPELLAFLEVNPPGRALDIGCGTGTNTLTMAQRGWQVLGIDFSSRAIRAARKKARLAGLSPVFEQADVSRLGGITGPFDMALDIGCFHSLRLTQQSAYARALACLLRPGGAFLLYGFLETEPNPASTLLSEQALALRFGDAFHLEAFVRGTDRNRPSAWATLRRKV